MNMMVVVGSGHAVLSGLFFYYYNWSEQRHY